MFTHSKKTVDFDHFDMGEGYNYQYARELCVILMSYQSVDELTSFSLEDEYIYPTTIGTGGTGDVYHVQTLAQQRSLLASHFASYSSREYTHCDIGLSEYNCIKELLLYLEEDVYIPGHRLKIVGEQITLLKKFISEFEKAYVRVDKAFLFTMLKK